MDEILQAMQADSQGIRADQDAADALVLQTMEDARTRIGAAFAKGWNYPGGLDGWLKSRQTKS